MKAPRLRTDSNFDYWSPFVVIIFILFIAWSSKQQHRKFENASPAPYKVR